LFNVVTAREGIPHAVLIRSVIPYQGIEQMMRRRSLASPGYQGFTGPGKVAEALGLHFSMSGTDLTGNKIWLEDEQIKVPSESISASPRIGIAYAAEHALFPWRYQIENIDNFTEWKFLK
jgi:DNA-3-methyladenine glycosylase